MGYTIHAQMRPDWVEPYSSMGQEIPVVVSSAHPRFGPGTRFDYGFLRVALEEGCAVIILPSLKSERGVDGVA